MDTLPADCIADILSRGSPRDACHSAVVATVFRTAVESDVLWDKFLPLDHREIIAQCVSPVTYTSKKELFFKLTSPLLIDHGRKAFLIDIATGKKCYMLSARELYVAWSGNALFWCWKPLTNSRFKRFAEAVELRMTSWLEVEGKINTRSLSAKTMYKAYLIVQVAHDRAFGLDIVPCEVSVEVGELCSRGTLTLSRDACIKRSSEQGGGRNKAKKGLRSRFENEVARVGCERKDGWLEIELGEFYNEGLCDKEVKMSFREVNGAHLKGGLIVEALEIRPL
ncbi:hypothetical protein QVD17_25954 [Tagetes erecta]|uniref:F-box domain-containing protein n=1 Tax=Tagetes erecta TaxID=13708 RepID=A0AAD8NPW6_TARER|nr:hypothetical protein QVD17_25954 [Tagetes erecta]